MVTVFVLVLSLILTLHHADTSKTNGALGCPSRWKLCDKMCEENGALRGRCEGVKCQCLPKWYGSQLRCPGDWLYCDTTCQYKGFDYGRCSRFGKCYCYKETHAK